MYMFIMMLAHCLLYVVRHANFFTLVVIICRFMGSQGECQTIKNKTNLTLTIVLTIYSRCTNYEWDNPHPCNDETDEDEFDLCVANCLWHNWGSIMEQGSDIAPRYRLNMPIGHKNGSHQHFIRTFTFFICQYIRATAD